MLRKHRLRSGIWRVLFLAFIALYALSFFLLVVGTFGWFGQQEDPLGGVFLLPLGLPWNFIADKIGIQGVAVLLLAPLINAGILYWLWKR